MPGRDRPRGQPTLRCASVMPGRSQPGPPSLRGSLRVFRRDFLTVSVAGAAGASVLLPSADASYAQASPLHAPNRGALLGGS